MDGISAYTTFIENEDSISEEVLSLENEMKSLVRRKFELECQLNVPRPRKFKDIYENTEPSQRFGDIEEWDLSNLKMIMHYYELCGIYVTEVDSGMCVCFKTAHGSKGYYISLKNNTDSLMVDKYFLPPTIPVKELSDQLSMGGKVINKLCRKIYHYIDVFEDRLNQISTLRANADLEKIDVFNSHSVEYIKIEVKMIDSSARLLKACVHLHYQPDVVYPQKVTLDCNGIEREEKAMMTEKCKAFKSMPLLLAVRTAFFCEV